MARESRMSRLAVLATVAMVLGSLLSVRLWFLQAIDAPGLEQRVQEVRTRTVKLTSERGRIFDIKGRTMADNERLLTITMDRAVVAKPLDRQQMWNRLSGALNMSVEELENRFVSKRYNQLQPLPLKEDVSEELAIFLRERSEDYPGIDIAENCTGEKLRWF